MARALRCFNIPGDTENMGILQFLLRSLIVVIPLETLVTQPMEKLSINATFSHCMYYVIYRNTPA